jgi:hypothetical protein
MDALAGIEKLMAIEEIRRLKAQRDRPWPAGHFRGDQGPRRRPRAVRHSHVRPHQAGAAFLCGMLSKPDGNLGQEKPVTVSSKSSSRSWSSPSSIASTKQS